jgi:hypothetical protein
MSEGDGYFYNRYRALALSGEIHLGVDKLKFILVESYSPDIDGDEYYSDVSGYEVTGDGYVEGGKTLSGEYVSKDDTNNKGVFHANDILFEGLNVGTPSHGILYDDTHSLKPLISYWEIGIGTDGTDVTLVVSTSGMFSF